MFNLKIKLSLLLAYKTSFSHGNANSCPSLQILALLTGAIDPCVFYLIQTSFAPATSSNCFSLKEKKPNKPKNILQKNLTARTSHRLHTSIQTTVTLRLIHVASLCKGVLVIFTSLLSGMWPPALSVMRCVCVLSKSQWTHTEMQDDDRIRPRVWGGGRWRGLYNQQELEDKTKQKR